MVDTQLQDYWTLVSGAREGDESCLDALALLADEPGRAGRLARLYLLQSQQQDTTGSA